MRIRKLGFLMTLIMLLQISAASTYATSNPAMTPDVRLRGFPYPYQAMLAIDSDADHQDLRKFNLIHEFLNTNDETVMGRGLGLDIADSFFLYNGSNKTGMIDYDGTTVKNEMTMFQGATDQPSAYAPILLRYIRHGWIDTFHGAGDFTQKNPSLTLFSRPLVVQAMRFLQQQHVPPIIDFTDHGNQSNVDNFGSYVPSDSYMRGDHPRSPYFIADLIRQEGVKFLWPDRYDNQYVYSSMIFPVKLHDGSWIWEFHRYTGIRRFRFDKGYKTAIWLNVWNPSVLYEELSPNLLNQLIQKGGYTILATHLEGNANQYPFDPQTILALENLARLQSDGKILVAATSRLLWYNLVHSGLVYKVQAENGITVINILRVHDPVDGDFIPAWQDLRGITWQVADSASAEVEINGIPLPASALLRSSDSVGIVWYPPNTVDWSVSLNTPEYRLLENEMKQREGRSPHLFSDSFNKGFYGFWTGKVKPLKQIAP